MTGQTDQAKGRIKEAAGKLTDDGSLENEGRVDRIAGEVKEKVGDAKDKVDELVEKAKDAVHDLRDRRD